MSFAYADNNPLLTKINKILKTEIQTDSDLIDGLNSLSTVLPTNSIRHRRNLRSEIEKRRAGLYEDFLNQFTLIKKSVDILDSCINDMLSTCRNMNAQLVDIKQKTSGLIDEAASLQERSRKNELKIHILECISHSFQIPSEDHERLCSQTFVVDLAFISALSRARTSENNCKLLIQAGGQSFGLGMLDAIHTVLETAYQRLYQWTQSECRTKTQEVPEFSPFLRCCLEALLDRPVLLKYILDEYAATRRSTTVKAFIDALTIGVDANTSHGLSGSYSKPIDLRSHDPVRYIGDIMAWLHQLTASEKEYVNMLTHDCIDRTSSIDELFTACLDGVTVGLCSPFKLRLEQLLVSLQDPVLLYRINNVLRFYEHTLSGLLGTSSQLFTTVAELQELSWRLLFNSLHQYTRQVLEQSDHPNFDLSPSSVVRDTLELLLEILRAHDISLLSTEIRKASIDEITSTVIEPLLTYCQNCADRLQQTALTETVSYGDSLSINNSNKLFRKAKAATYLTNCYYLIQTSLARLDFTTNHLEHIAELLNVSLESLVTAQVCTILRSTRLYIMVQIIEEGHEPLRDGPLINRCETGLSEADVHTALALFDTYLSNPDTFCLSELQYLNVQRLRKVVRRRAADEVHSRYQLLYNALSDPANGYASFSKLADDTTLRTPQQVAELILNF